MTTIPMTSRAIGVVRRRTTRLGQLHFRVSANAYVRLAPILDRSDLPSLRPVRAYDQAQAVAVIEPDVLRLGLRLLYHKRCQLSHDYLPAGTLFGTPAKLS